IPVPPPPAPPPPPTFAQANVEKPSLNRSEQAGRNALLSDISKGKRLKQAVTNDRSAPVLDSKYNYVYFFSSLYAMLNRPPMLPPGARATSAKPFSPAGGVGRFAGPLSGPRSGGPESQRNRMPPPRPDACSKPDTGPPPVPSTPRPIPSSLHSRASPPVPGVNRQVNIGPTPPPFPGNRSLGFGGHIHQSTHTPFSNRPPLPPTPGRPTDDKPPPPPPPTGNRPSPNRETSLPPPPPQNNKPPVPSTPRPSLVSQVPPPPPPSRPGPPPFPPTSSGNDEMPRLPQRNLSLGAPSPPSFPGASRSGPLPPPPGERPPPPGRDPPSRSGPLPPPPPVIRNGSSLRALPATPQLPSRGGLENQRSGTRPPLPPDRPGSGAPPPPPPPSIAIRNGFQDSSHDDEWESRFFFHPVSDLPPPEPYVPMNKSYPSKLARNENRSGSNRKERGVPPLPPIPR
uniref:WAS/WASL-interacting protein family member 1 n=1 Tax=Sphenodon punctatus TaxID=8508 RepID=A0A8D0GDE0_SPHPU